MIGRKILHYKILEKLGEGGMGVVYKAEDTKLKRTVALKFLPSHSFAADEEKARFQHEAQAAAGLDHPNICTVYEINEADGQSFIAMAYIEGQSLQEMADTPLPLNDAVNYASQIAEGLQAAHEKNIVHRDIKPANVLITEKGQVKITDFGLAKLGGRTQLTKEGTSMGTVAYMSPEQAQGANVDHRTDIWALGAVMYEMIIGQQPFHGDYEQAVIYSVMNEDPEPLTGLRTGVPMELERIVLKALAKEPDERYQHVDEMLVDLKNLQKTLETGITKSRTTNVRVIGRSPLRKRIWFIAAPIIILLLAAIWVISRRDSQPTPTQASRQAIAVLPFSVRGGEEIAYLREGIVDLLSTKLDGAGGWRSVDPRAILGLVARQKTGSLDPQQGRDIAEKLKASFYVLGNIVEIGSRLQLHASLYDREHGLDAVADGTAAGEATQLFGLVDEVAAQLLVGRSEGSGTRVDRIEAVTTSSLPALKAYLEGEDAFRKGEFQPAVDAFQRAVTDDSTFALAHYRLSIAAEWRTMSELSFKAAERALRLADRLSERDNRLFEAFLAYRYGKAMEAEQLYRTIISAYPDDVEALIQLAEVLFHYNPLHGRPFTESEEVFERVLHYEPDDAASLIHLARITASQGRLDEMSSYVEKVLKLIPTGEREMEMRVLRAVAIESEAEIDQLMTQLRTEGELSLTQSIWIAPVYSQKIKASMPLISLLTSPTRTSEARSLGHSWLAYLYVATGQWQLAKKELDAIESYDSVSALENLALLFSLPFLNIPVDELQEIRRQLEQVKPVDRVPSNPSFHFNVHDDIHTILQSYLLGLLSARVGDNDAAIQHATQLAQLEAPESGGTIATDLALSVRSQIDLIGGRLKQALALLEQTRNETWYHKTLSSPFYAQTHQRFMRAELLRKLGRGEEALGWYESLPAITPFGLVYLAISHLRRGEIYESLGQEEQAVEHYSRFIELWRDCDPELQPLLEDAKEKLSELRKVTTQ